LFVRKKRLFHFFLDAEMHAGMVKGRIIEANLGDLVPLEKRYENEGADEIGFKKMKLVVEEVCLCVHFFFLFRTVSKILSLETEETSAFPDKQNDTRVFKSNLAKQNCFSKPSCRLRKQNRS